MHNKHEKIAWRLSLIYVSVSLLTFFLQKSPHLAFSLAFQFLLIGIFYMGFKKRWATFSALAFSWLLLGSLKGAIAVSRLNSEIEGSQAVFLGAVIALGFSLITTYFALRAFLSQLKLKKQRRS